METKVIRNNEIKYWVQEARMWMRWMMRLEIFALKDQICIQVKSVSYLRRCGFTNGKCETPIMLALQVAPFRELMA